jgi:hypothetical protein
MARNRTRPPDMDETTIVMVRARSPCLEDEEGGAVFVGMVTEVVSEVAATSGAMLVKLGAIGRLRTLREVEASSN